MSFHDLNIGDASEMARAEREMLSERIKSGLTEARRKGRKLGRPTWGQ